ncbi:unnamed protein product [Ixodes pacificus]
MFSSEPIGSSLRRPQELLYEIHLEIFGKQPTERNYKSF